MPSTTQTVTVDQWLEAGRGGMTDARLDEVFELVKPDGNWKLPIAARVPVELATAAELATAVAWYTGGHGTVEPITAQPSGEQSAWWVTAPGYYASCGA